MSQEYRLKNIDETRNYFPEKIIKINWWLKSTEKILQLQIILNTFLFYLLQLHIFI